jgi:threonine aldolase
MDLIDMRSDTVSMPTSEMMQAMSKAKLGDSILGEDPTVRELEELGAELFGKEGAIFVVSGTMANQVAVATFTKRGQEVIVGQESHIYNFEVAGLAAISQVQPRPISCPKGFIDPVQVKNAIREPEKQVAETGLLCLENTYNLNRGYIMSLKNIQEISKICKENGIPIYMDGARVFNAAVAMGINIKEIVDPVDAVQLCLTKGLGAPIGSLLMGNKEFLVEAKRIQQRLGGGMRQGGVIAAAGIIALEQMVDRLNDDHENAKYLAKRLLEIDERLLRLEDVQTNIVSIDIGFTRMDGDVFLSLLKEKGILIKKIGSTSFRMICYHNIDREKIKKVIDAIYMILEKEVPKCL